MKSVQKYIIGLVTISLFFMAQITWAQVEFSQNLYAKLAQSASPMPKIKIPEYQKVTLDNGLIIYLVEDHDLPILAINGTIRWGRGAET
ncbi:MAG TPA: hypothetical protein VEC37_15705 [Bacillota bacterium]|nr:hypothetical protein [Bacillota bacterium]